MMKSGGNISHVLLTFWCLCCGHRFSSACLLHQLVLISSCSSVYCFLDVQHSITSASLPSLKNHEQILRFRFFRRCVGVFSLALAQISHRCDLPFSARAGMSIPAAEAACLRRALYISMGRLLFAGIWKTACAVPVARL